MDYTTLAIDLGAIVPVTPIVSVDAGGATVTIEEQHSDDDVMYSALAAITGEITARYFRIKVSLTSAEITGIKSMTVTMDANVLEEAIEDSDTSTYVQPNVAQQMVLTDAASGPFQVGEQITDDSDSNLTGTITSVSGTEPNVTIQYYPTGSSGNFGAGTGGFTGDTSGSTASAVAPTNVTGDYRLPIQKSYTFIRSVLLTLQSTGAGYSIELIDKDVTLGPRVKIYNGSDTLASATIDALVRGI